jgi:hypothetical protein
MPLFGCTLEIAEMFGSGLGAALLDIRAHHNALVMLLRRFLDSQVMQLFKSGDR